MAGHSHWAGIKHKKAMIDNKRGKAWSKISKAIIIAAKLGGGDPATNPRLRLALLDARAANMTKDAVQRNIKKGTGELEGGDVEEIVYEGYGPNGVAVLCDIFTDNRNRTAPEIRKIFENNGGKLEKTNSVAWMFERKGLVLINREKIGEERLMEIALECGADDVKTQGDNFEVLCDVDVYNDFCTALENAEIEVESKQLTRIPSNTVDLDVETARVVLKLLEELDEHDDVQNVSSNFNITDEAMAEISQS